MFFIIIINIHTVIIYIYMHIYVLLTGSYLSFYKSTGSQVCSGSSLVARHRLDWGGLGYAGFMVFQWGPTKLVGGLEHEFYFPQ